MRPEFWQGKRVFLTGHTGFKGSWLVLLLDALGAKVHGYALPPDTARGSLYAQLGLESQLAGSTYADIRDGAALAGAMRAAAPEIVIHMAAQPLVRASYADPNTTFATNVMGTVNLFDAVRAVGGVRAVLNVTTDKCYENLESMHAYREDDRLGGYDPYAASKACAELVTASYRQSFFAAEGVAVASARAGNVIGGGDFSADRIIPDIVAAVQRGEPVVLRAPQAVRPWQHVLDVLAGYCLLVERLSIEGTAVAGAYNFGPDDAPPVTVEMLTQHFLARIGQGNYHALPDATLHETGLLRLDNGKAKQALGWQPRYTQHAAVEHTADWFSAYLADADMGDVTRRQLAAYRALAA